MSTVPDEVFHLSRIANSILNVGGMLIFVCGIIGNFMNILAFATLPQFNRVSTSMFLLTSHSGSFITLLTGLLPQLIFSLTGYDPLVKYIVLCKLRWFLGVTTATVAIYSLCFATFTQYLLTTTSVRCRQIITRRRAVFISVGIYASCAILLGPNLFYYTHLLNSINQTVCDVNNPAIAVYNVYNSVFIYTAIPIFVLILFSILIWKNLRNRSNQRYSSLEKTVAHMLFAHIIIVLIAAVAFSTRRVYLFYTADIKKDLIRVTQDRIITNVSTCFGFSLHGFTFIIYLVISKTFRRKLFASLLPRRHRSTVNVWVQNKT